MCPWLLTCLLAAPMSVPATAAEPGVIFDLNDRPSEPVQKPAELAPKPAEKTPEKPKEKVDGPAATPLKPAAVQAKPPVKAEPAQPAKGVPAPDSAQVKAPAQTWETFWAKAAHKASVCGGDFVLAPAWSPEFPSSLTVLRDMRRYDIPVPAADLPAARALPGLNPGDYGELHSVEVVKILGPADMVVKAPWLYDPDRGPGVPGRKASRLWELARENQAEIAKPGKLRPRLFHLTGFPTDAVREGDRYCGPVGARMRVVVGCNERSPKEAWQEIPMLANLDTLLRRPLSDGEAKALLAKRGLDLARFVDLVRAAESANPKSPESAQAAVLRQLAAKEAQVNALLPAGLE